MERKKLFVRVGIGVAGALLLVGIFAVANAVGDSNAMRRGIDEGFELRGTYQGDPGRDGIGTIAFQTLDGEPSWEPNAVRSRGRGHSSPLASQRAGFSLFHETQALSRPVVNSF